MTLSARSLSRWSELTGSWTMQNALWSIVLIQIRNSPGPIWLCPAQPLLPSIPICLVDLYQIFARYRGFFSCKRRSENRRQLYELHRLPASSFGSVLMILDSCGRDCRKESQPFAIFRFSSEPSRWETIMAADITELSGAKSNPSDSARDRAEMSRGRILCEHRREKIVLVNC